MHLSFLRYVQEEHERTHGVPLNVVVLEYCELCFCFLSPSLNLYKCLIALAPTHQFPTQLRQAVSALLHLFKSGVSPDQIIIGGDSAGGNLALALAAHILHPHPEVERIELKVPLAGVLLISPGVSRDVSMRSKDSIHPLSYQRMYASMPLDTAPGAWPGRQALHAPEGWWADLRAVTPRVLITSGEHENMYTCISDFGRRLNAEAEGMQVETLSEAGAPHINPVADLSAMGDGPGKGAQRVAVWLCEV
jgi:acetyl esterase/lipase